jgi:hypothetical protein
MLKRLVHRLTFGEETMSDTRSRSGILVGFAAAVGAFGAAAMMSTATARADGTTEIYVPDPATLDAQVAEGFPPFISVLQGQEEWTVPGLPSGNAFEATGADTQTTFGSFTNDDFLYLGSFQGASGPVGVAVPDLTVGTQIDLANFGGGFENEWIDALPEGQLDGGIITDTLITPFGDFTLF